MFTPKALSRDSRTRWFAALVTGAAAIAAISAIQPARAATGACAMGATCERDLLQQWSHEQRSERYASALQRSDGPETASRSMELSDQDYTAFSGVGMIVCSLGNKLRSSTAFLVGAFDIGVTVAHTFEKDSSGAEPTDCVYNSVDSLGQIRERIPVSYVKSQWHETGAFGQPTTDLAVVRLSKPSRYAQRTMPLGRFSGHAAPVVMIGYKSDVGAATVKRKARGTVYDRDATGLAIADPVGFTHDLYSRGIAAGAPVIDERTGVIIGIHTGLPERNAMITMNDWLESTLRAEMQTRAQVEPEQRPEETARAN